jgi:hypothetical protein
MTRRRPPKQIKVLGQRVAVDYSNAHLIQSTDKGDNLPLYGSFDADYSTIMVAQHQGREMKRETILHETLHAVMSAMGMKDYLGRCGASRNKCDHEVVVEALGVGLLAVLRDNPTLVAYLTDRSPL